MKPREWVNEHRGELRKEFVGKTVLVCEDRVMKIEEIKKTYQGEWLAIGVIKEEKGKPLEGELIARAKDRDEIWDKHLLERT